jgi:hypothetical protein
MGGPWRVFERLERVVRLVDEKDAGLASRAPNKNVIELVTIHVGNRKPGTELREFSGEQELTLIIVERIFVVFEFQPDLLRHLDKHA